MISGCDRYCQGGQNRYFLGGTRLGLGVAIGVLPLQDTLSARDDHSFAQKKYIIRSCVKKQSTKKKRFRSKILLILAFLKEGKHHI